VTSIVFRDRSFSLFIIIFFIFCATRIQIYICKQQEKNIVNFFFLAAGLTPPFPLLTLYFFHGFNHQLYLSGWSSQQKRKEKERGEKHSESQKRRFCLSFEPGDRKKTTKKGTATTTRLTDDIRKKLR
jgi:flagellar biosynthesis component FlhA